jgi:hypothetical protein
VDVALPLLDAAPVLPAVASGAGVGTAFVATAEVPSTTTAGDPEAVADDAEDDAEVDAEPLEVVVAPTVLDDVEAEAVAVAVSTDVDDELEEDGNGALPVVVASGLFGATVDVTITTGTLVLDAGGGAGALPADPLFWGLTVSLQVLTCRTASSPRSFLMGVRVTTHVSVIGPDGVLVV